MTALASALTNAGFNSDKTRLFNVAHDILNKYQTESAVTARLVDVVRRDTGLLTEVVRSYVEQRIADREGISLKGEASGQPNNADHRSLAARTVEGEGGLASGANGQFISAPSPSSEHDRQSHLLGANNGQSALAKSVVPIPAAPSNLVPVQGHLRGKWGHKQRSMEERQAIRGAFSTVNQSILDTYRLSNGDLLADKRFGQLAALEAMSMKDAIVIRLVRQHCVAPPETKVRDAIKAEQLKIFIEQACDQTKEIAHAS